MTSWRLLVLVEELLAGRSSSFFPELAGRSSWRLLVLVEELLGLPFSSFGTFALDLDLLVDLVLDRLVEPLGPLWDDSSLIGRRKASIVIMMNEHLEQKGN